VTHPIPVNAFQGSGVNAIENALWDLAGQAYGGPIYQMLGGKFRDKIRMYSEGDPKSNSIADIAADYKERVASGFTMLKYDLPVAPILRGKPGTIYASNGYYGQPGDVPPRTTVRDWKSLSVAQDQTSRSNRTSPAGTE
jgi:hypothetical protein